MPMTLVHVRYGQMTAGSYCYIGPQGIVHGTTVSSLSSVRQNVNLYSHNNV